MEVFIEKLTRPAKNIRTDEKKEVVRSSNPPYGASISLLFT